MIHQDYNWHKSTLKEDEKWGGGGGDFKLALSPHFMSKIKIVT